MNSYVWWNHERFAEAGNLPSVVAPICDYERFSTPSGIRVLDMCIRSPRDGWQIPDQIYGQFGEAIIYAETYERMWSPLTYVYITVDQKPVPPKGTQRRDGWHSDAFVVDERGRQVDVLADTAGLATRLEEIERTYVAYDGLPTLFADGPWNLRNPGDCDDVLESFDIQARDKVKITYPPYTLLCLTPYCVHCVQRHEGDAPLPRTFIKIQFSKHRYNREGNTLNPRIDYSGWTWVPRATGKREHRYA